MPPKKRTLLEAAYEQQSPVQARKTKIEPSVDQQVQKAIADNFKGFSPLEIDGIKVNNQSLRERLRADKLRNKEVKGTVVQGRAYYDELRSLYSSEQNPRKLLVIKNPALQVSTELWNAMKSAQKAPCNRAPLLAFLDYGPKPNHSELTGIYLWCIDLKPTVSPEQLKCIIAVMRFTKRHRLYETFVHEVDVLKACFNKALVQAFLTARKAKHGPQSFLERYHDIWPMVLPEHETSLLLALGSEESWSQHVPQLTKVVASGELGKRLFGFAMLSGFAEVVSQKIEETAEQCFEGAEHITTERIVRFKREAQQAILSMDGADSLPEKYSTKVLYRGVALQARVGGLNDEVAVRFNVRLRSCAVEDERLTPLLCEHDIVRPARGRDGRTWSEEVLADAAAAREFCQALLTAHEQRLAQLDPHWSLDKLFLESTLGETASARVEAKVLEILPTKDRFVELKDASARLTQLAASKLVLMSGKGAQGTLSAVQALLAEMLAGTPPRLGKSVSTHLQTVWTRLQHFAVWQCVLPHPETGEPEKQALYGTEAVLARWKELSVMDPKTVNLSDLEFVSVYGWLMPEDQQHELQELTMEVFKRASGMACVPKPETKQVQKKAKASSSTKASAEDAATAKNFG